MTSNAPSRGSKVVAIIQARMSSGRLPGKVLADIDGSPVLGLIVSRLARSTTIDAIAVATSTDPSDDAIADWCSQNSVHCFRGSLHDVLGRYLLVANALGPDHIVRITADCPFIDPSVVDRLVDHHLAHDLDYCGLSGEFPHGLDCEVFSFATLQTAEREATQGYDREHVTPFMKQRPERFVTARFAPIQGLHRERWTLDYPEDLAFVRAIASLLGSSVSQAGYAQILAALDSRPTIRELNAGRSLQRAN